MRCPKCHYLSFDPEPRCKNCGYDLEVDDADLALRTAERHEAPLPDLRLHARPEADTLPPVTLELVHADLDRDVNVEIEGHADVDGDMAVIDINDDVAAGVDEVVQAEEAPAPPVEVPRLPVRAPHTTTELPLFVRGLAERDDPAPPSMPAAARPPLAVRRTAPDPARARPKPADRRLGPLDHDLLEDLKRVEREEADHAREESRHAARAAASGDDRVDPMHRVGAAAIDVAVLGGIAGFVFWATLRLCSVSLWDLGLASLLPLLLFLGLMDLGYLLLFTAAGGQTVGKMLMGLRVVGDPADAVDTDDQVPLGQAAFRAVMTVVSVAGLVGLGWLPALFGSGLTLHDRVTHTRVVRA